ncbi:MAG: UDP-glucose/GDP-mannose dehydrogenase family protein [Rhodospirillaceae bacterium]|nr:UDP-glucose/GDP-mannose dehydrogenase family protein [Rhodospirillaceae bacterium]MBT7756348.1 UDP-glucose/GDP-mannose dehydrogenase family protein [Rhodospirillaceae bacterium]
MEKLYASLDAPIIVTTPETAELVKLATNSFLACAISFSNEMANIAEATANVEAADLFAGLHLDKRFEGPDGRRAAITAYLKPSSGYGGSCLPKDTLGFSDYAGAIGLESVLLTSISTVNQGRAGHIVELLQRSCPDLQSTDIAVLGLAFKAGTDDLRHSPSLKLLEQLAPRGGRVRAYDPNIQDVDTATSIEIEVMMSVDQCLQGARAVLILTSEPSFKTIDWGVSGIAEGAIIYDPWSVVGNAHGYEVIRLGNGPRI